MVSFSAQPVERQSAKTQRTKVPRKEIDLCLLTFCDLASLRLIPCLHERRLALDERRMRIIKSAEPPVRRQVREVLLGELSQSPNHRRRPAHRVAREIVGFIFI